MDRAQSPAPGHEKPQKPKAPSGENAGMSTSPPAFQKGTRELLQGQKTRAGLLISCSCRHHGHHTSFPFPPLGTVLTVVTSGPLMTVHRHFSVHVCVCVCLSRVRLFETLWTIAREAPLSIGFSRQEYWSGLPSPSPGIKPRTLAL